MSVEGGNDTIKLEIKNLPSNALSDILKGVYIKRASYRGITVGELGDGIFSNYVGTYGPDGAGYTLDTFKNIEDTWKSYPVDNLPPYFAIYWIIKVI